MRKKELENHIERSKKLENIFAKNLEKAEKITLLMQEKQQKVLDEFKEEILKIESDKVNKATKSLQICSYLEMFKTIKAKKLEKVDNIFEETLQSIDEELKNTEDLRCQYGSSIK